MIHRRDLFGQDNRITFNHETNAAAKLDGTGGGGGRHERHKEIIGMPVVAGEFSANRPGTTSAGRYVRMFRKPHRLEAALFTGAGQFVWTNGVIRSEH